MNVADGVGNGMNDRPSLLRGRTRWTSKGTGGLCSSKRITGRGLDAARRRRASPVPHLAKRDLLVIVGQLLQIQLVSPNFLACRRVET